VNDLLNYINSLNIIDSHEHLFSEEERRKKKIDLFILFSQYARSDLVSSGMPETKIDWIINSDNDIEERWNYFKKFWENIKNTNYSKLIINIVQDIYSFEDINGKNYVELSKAMDNTRKKDWYDYIITEKCKISYIINHLECIENASCKVLKRNDVKPVLCFDDIISICCIEDINKIEECFDMTINDFKDLIEVINIKFDHLSDIEYKSVKIGIAYMRELFFEEVTFHDADKIFMNFYKLKDYGYLSKKDFLSKKELKPFQDFIVHYILKKAAEKKLPVQIHTGIFEFNRNDIRNSNPLLLTNLFLKYDNVEFDIFHAGYPYTDELISVCKQFQNVYFNLCWINDISISLYKQVLNLLIEIIPSNKIIGFGGDYMFVEGIYGSQKILRRVIYELMIQKIREGYFNEDEAVGFVQKILFQNPKQLYKLE
jgi:uncharacterized protein